MLISQVRYEVIFILFALLPMMLRGQTQERRTEIMVDFPVNVTTIQPDFADNAVRIGEIIGFLKALNSDSTVSIVSVSFCGAASPEGSDMLNRRLSRGRLESLEALVRKEVTIPDSIISRDDSYIPWGCLREMIAASDRSYRDTVLAIIDEPTLMVNDIDNGKPVDRRVVRLKQLDNRRVWTDMLHSYFAEMRNASAIILTYRQLPNWGGVYRPGWPPCHQSRIHPLPCAVP